MKKIIVLIICIVSVAMTANAQVQDVTPSTGLTLVKSATTPYVIPVGKLNTPFTLHSYSSGSVDDTTSIKVWFSNISTGAWELQSTNTLVPSDTSDLVVDTCFARYIKVSVTAGNNDSTGVVHLKWFH